jgi:hypothetical protein
LLYVIISIRFFLITICNLLIELPSYNRTQYFRQSGEQRTAHLYKQASQRPQHRSMHFTTRNINAVGSNSRKCHKTLIYIEWTVNKWIQPTAKTDTPISLLFLYNMFFIFQFFPSIHFNIKRNTVNHTWSRLACAT